MKYDVIIIGAGLGGLECATLLSRAGMHVLVLEQGAQVGGAMQSFARGGELFDTGFHCVGGLSEGGRLHEAFRRLGLLQLPWHRLDDEAPALVMMGGRQFRLPAGGEALTRALAQEFPRHRQGLRALCSLLDGVARGSAFGMAGTFLSDEAQLETCAYDYLIETLGDPLLLNVLSAPAAMKMELHRESLPLYSFAHCQAPFLEGGWRLRGDGGMIADALLAQVRAGGGQVLCRKEVERLTVNDNRVDEVWCTGADEPFRASWVVSSLHPAATCRLLSPAMHNSYSRRMARQAGTVGMFTVQLRLKPCAVRYFNYNAYVFRKPNVWTFTDDVGGVGGVMVSARVPQDDSPWVSMLDLLTPMPWRLWQQWASHRDDAYRDFKRRLARECIDLASRLLPGLSDAVVACYTSTPVTWQRYTRTPAGSAFGRRKDWRQPLAAMLPVRTPLANLLLTGQSVGLHGVQGVTMTAFETCRHIMNR